MGKTFRKACAKLHLWLGLLSGIVVFIVCITGCLYAFKDEITDAMQPWRFVDPQEKEFLLPSRILAIADSVMEGASATAIRRRIRCGMGGLLSSGDGYEHGFYRSI